MKPGEIIERMAELRGNKPDHVEIRVGDFAPFLAAIERSGVGLITDPKVVEHSFAGVPVIMDWKVPQGFGCIVVNGEVSALLDFRALAEREG